MQQHRLPQRTCIACRSTSDKRELVRVVRTPDGRVEVDTTGKAAGRGAYLCNRRECWQDALKKGRLEAALKTKIGVDEKLRLVEYTTQIEAVAV